MESLRTGVNAGPWGPPVWALSRKINMGYVMLSDGLHRTHSKRDSNYDNWLGGYVFVTASNVQLL